MINVTLHHELINNDMNKTFVLEYTCGKDGFDVTHSQKMISDFEDHGYIMARYMYMYMNVDV